MFPIVRHVRRAVFVMLLLASPAWSQTLPPVSPQIDLSGPRVGFTLLSGGIVDKLADNSLHVRPLITQFGWQFEKRFYGGENGLSAVTECVVLAGGLEQGVLLPSLSWLAGLRTRNGVEFGLGPNVTPVGTALVFAAGATFRSGALNFPVNLAVAPSKSGVRVSLLAGFNTRR